MACRAARRARTISSKRNIHLPRLGQQGVDAPASESSPVRGGPAGTPWSETYVPAVRRFSTNPAASSSR